MRIAGRTWGVLVLPALLACAGGEPGAARPLAGDVDPPARVDLAPELRKIAVSYIGYGRVDDENRWTPTMCKLSPSVARASESAHEPTHGRKLYYIFSKDRDAYVFGLKKKQPVGQVIVKEAWKPKEPEEGDIRYLPGRDKAGSFRNYAEMEGKLYVTGEKAGLYVMMKLDPKTAGADDGWVYATMTADGKSVISSGRVATCMKCHEGAPGDRVFGLEPYRSRQGSFR